MGSQLSDSANVLIGDTTYESHPADAGWGFLLFFTGPELLVTAWYLNYEATFESTFTISGHNIGEYCICHEGCSIRFPCDSRGRPHDGFILLYRPWSFVDLCQRFHATKNTARFPSPSLMEYCIVPFLVQRMTLRSSEDKIHVRLHKSFMKMSLRP